MSVGSSLSTVSEGSFEGGAEQALEVDEFILALESMGKLPKLPIYRPKGVWTDTNDLPKQHALIWAHDYYSTATENTKRFIVNAVAAIFEWHLLRYCSEKCSNEGPCPKCGHWDWVPKPINKKVKDEKEVNPLLAKDTSEDWSLLDNFQDQSKGPGSLITKEGMRCAVSVIIATKADYWAEGPVKTEEINHSDQVEVKGTRKMILGKQASTMVQSLYPSWSLDDAAEAVTVAGLWANTRHIIGMIGETPLSKCIPLWDIVPNTKLILSPELKKSFTSYPAGTEDMLNFLKIANDLVSSPLLLYFPNARDLTVLLRAKESVKEHPFNYHVCAEDLGLEPKMEHDIRSVYGRLGCFHSAKKRANAEALDDIWAMEKLKESTDFNEEYADVCEAFYGLKTTTEEAACVLLHATPKNSTNVLDSLLGEYNVTKSEKQQKILATRNA